MQLGRRVELSSLDRDTLAAFAQEVLDPARSRHLVRTFGRNHAVEQTGCVDRLFDGVIRRSGPLSPRRYPASGGIVTEIVWFDGADPEMDGAARQAQGTFRYFWREMTWEHRRIVPGLEVAAVKAPFTHREAPGLLGRLFGGGAPVEHMWISEVTFDGSRVRGALLNTPHALRGWKAGDAVEVPLDRLSDWMYAIGGEVYGAHTVQLIRRRMAPAERDAHDAAWGLDFGDPDTVRLVPAWGRADPDVEHPMSQNIVAKWAEQLAASDGPGLLGADHDGWTQLHYLALGGSFDNVDLLLRHGADPNARTPDGRTPLALARSLGWRRVEERLLAAGAVV